MVKNKKLPAILKANYRSDMSNDAGCRLAKEAKNLMAIANDLENMGHSMINSNFTPRHVKAMMLLKDVLDVTVELIAEHVSAYAKSSTLGDEKLTGGTK